MDAKNEAAVLPSPVLHPVEGSGGNGERPSDDEIAAFPNLHFVVPGQTRGGCVVNGSFAKRKVSMGLEDWVNYQPDCLRRDISAWLLTISASSAVVRHVLDSTSYFEFNERIQGGLMPEDITIHWSVHIGIGGNSGDIANVILRLAILSSTSTMRTWTVSGISGNGRVSIHVWLSDND